MKAVLHHKYGGPEVLKVEEVDQPVPRSEEVLVKVVSSAVNDYDWATTTGDPFLYRLLFGLFKPRQPILGMEMAGEIEVVGAEVTKFKKGDFVFGDTSDHGFGTFAEMIAIHEDALTLKPENMSFEDAAALPHAGLLAFQGLVNLGGIKKGFRVLLNGAGGGVGTLALQIAKKYHCEVTGVDTGEKLERMKELGFDHVIDYKRENFTKKEEKYDLILDCKTFHSAFAYPGVLKKGGIYVTVGGSLLRMIQILLVGKLVRWFTGRQLKILGLKPNKDLDKVIELYQEGVLKPEIDGPYRLEDTPEQVGRFGRGEHSGKIVVRV